MTDSLDRLIDAYSSDLYWRSRVALAAEVSSRRAGVGVAQIPGATISGTHARNAQA
jgi:hypothetical protein